MMCECCEVTKATKMIGLNKEQLCDDCYKYALKASLKKQ